MADSKKQAKGASLAPPVQTGGRSKTNVDAKDVASRSSVSNKSQIRSGSKPSITKSQVRSKSKLYSQSKAGIRSMSQARIGDGGGDEEEWVEQRDPVKPDDQLELTEEELKQEFTRIIHAVNPHAPDNVVRFSQKDRVYAQTSMVDQMEMHFSLDGNLIHKESDEARRQTLAASKKKRVTSAVATATSTTDTGTGDDAAEGGAGEGEGEEKEAAPDAEEGGGEEEEEAAAAGSDKKPLRNQFNFSERASQTFNYAPKVRGSQTIPPPRARYAGMANQWIIYDAYVQAKAKADAAAAAGDKKGAQKGAAATVQTKHTSSGLSMNSEDSGLWAAAANIVKLEDAKKLERMVNQNTFDDVNQDFRYWEDASDEFKDGVGTLLPLWKFTTENTKKRTVTALAWNPLYADLCAVGYGSYDFLKQDGGGVVNCFSIKNPSAPEYSYQLDSGVMCIDYHQTTTNLLAVGLYDGSVVVFDLAQRERNEPLYRSTAKTGKHTDPVWQVKWQENDIDMQPNFVSVSSDGRVTSWTLVKNELHCLDLLQLRKTNEGENGEDDESTAPPGAATSISFHPKESHVYLLGTEEGAVNRCSKAYSSKFLDSYDAHSMAVYSVNWNPHHPKVFVSCSVDWAVKVWHSRWKKPVFQFDLGTAVSDVAWAPYSSSVFAAVTTTGKVVVYDLSVNKYEPICDQAIMRKGKPTHIAFNATYPIVLVGDDRGGVVCLKLSPNLRKAMGKKKLNAEQQISQVDKIFDSVLENYTPEIVVVAEAKA